eukprot:15474113-Alexandrium_andersonii.AAC.1
MSGRVRCRYGSGDGAYCRYVLLPPRRPPAWTATCARVRAGRALSRRRYGRLRPVSQSTLLASSRRAAR